MAIVLKQADRVLLIRRAEGLPRAGYWSPPTGRVEPFESLGDAAVREAREELGISVRPIAEVWQCDTDDGRYHLHWWQVELLDGEIRPAAAEVAEWRWVSPDAFTELNPVFDAHRVFFERLRLEALKRGDPYT